VAARFSAGAIAQTHVADRTFRTTMVLSHLGILAPGRLTATRVDF